MAQGRCSKPDCQIILTADNATPTVFRDGYGYCLQCASRWHKKRYKESPTLRETVRTANREFRRSHPERIRITEQSLRGRHKVLRKRLKKEGVPETDFLWRFNFYAALVADQECHYCGGKFLASFGPGLDRKDSKEKHVCYNVVPCCRPCNTRKMHDLSYEEMWLLAPVLRNIRIAKESKIV